MQEEYEKELNLEIEKRIRQMENPQYEFPKRFSKKDYMLVLVVAGISLIWIIIGAYL